MLHIVICFTIVIYYLYWLFDFFISTPASFQCYSGHSSHEEASDGSFWGLYETEPDPSVCTWDQGHHNIHAWICPQEAVHGDPRVERQHAQQPDERSVQFHRVKESLPPGSGQSQRDHPCWDPHHCREEQTCLSFRTSWSEWVCARFNVF